jgi:FkbM family methyltransferase
MDERENHSAGVLTARPKDEPGLPRPAGSAAKKTFVSLADRIGQYRPARNLYHRSLNRGYWRFRLGRREFFRQFVAPGDLVFDIGANKGEYTEMLLELGARVVAVEPEPTIARRTKQRFPQARLVTAAAGPARGRARLRINRHPALASLSERWITVATPDDWTGEEIDVPVVTLDQLIEEHGYPAFVKIDVEGYEAEVLTGLSEPLPQLWFEYQCRLLTATEEALARLVELAVYEFNLTQNYPSPETRFLLPAHTGRDALLSKIENLRTHDERIYGDIHARRRSQSF